MKVTMRVRYDNGEVLEAMKALYVAKFGKPPEGYELVATDEYRDIVVETVEIEKPTDPEVSPL